MAFSTYRGKQPVSPKQAAQTAASGETPIPTRPVLKKTLPSKSLFDLKDPMPYVNAASTDIRRWWK